MATTRLMALHIGKGQSTSTAIQDVIGYVENPEKTDAGRLILGYGCDSRFADGDFLLAKRQYEHITGRTQKDGDVLAYHLRQSFKPGEVTAEEAGRIGYELAMRFTKGKHQFVVATHIDKAHIHNHIIFNSTKLDCTGKFRNFFFSGRAFRRLNDQICIEHGLSVVLDPQGKTTGYDKWQGSQKPQSYRDKLRAAIDRVLEEKPADFAAFLALMEAAGYTVKSGKHILFTAPGQQRGTRCDTLCGDYTEQAIRERIEGIRVVSTVRKTDVSAPPKLQFYIDIENSLKAKNSPGYEQWAKVFNLKQMAQAVLFVRDNNMESLDAVTQRAQQAGAEFHALKGAIQGKSARMNEIAELQKQIKTYSVTRDIYTAYRKSGYSQKFYEEHAEKIILHKAAKEAFSRLGTTKLPTISALKQEYAALLAEKKKLYQAYHPAKERMMEWTKAKYNIERLLNVPEAVKRKGNER